MSAERLAAARAALAARGVDALLVGEEGNRRYLSGFRGHDSPPSDSAGYLIVTQADAVLITDFRYVAQAQREASGFRVLRSSRGLASVLPQVAAELGLQRIGFEEEYLPYALYRSLQEAAPAGAPGELVPTRNIVEEQRQVKDAGELDLIARAARITDEAFAHLLGRVAPGMTERAVAWELERFMREHGADDVAFPIIVASGPQAALPHAIAGERPLARGEPVLIDMGATVDGYHSDFTRTFWLGRDPEPDFLAAYDLLLHAQQRAEAAIRAGVSGGAVDAVARDLIAAGGYAEAFGHGLGHGVGLAIHEGPSLRAGNEQTLRPGMVVTVEPGVYLPGRWGIRIEDLVVVRDDDARVLTGTSRDLIKVG